MNESFTLTRIQDDGINSVDGFNTAGYIMMILYFISIICKIFFIADRLGRPSSCARILDPKLDGGDNSFFSNRIAFGDVLGPDNNPNCIFGQNWQNDRGRTTDFEWRSSANRRSKRNDATW